jgi:PHP family Zn ribbon phosphoesterase
VDSVKRKDPNILRFTIETNPAYGKYHWTGHRECGVSLPPEEAIRLGNVCPVCHRRLTRGVEQRVEELADRPYGFRPPGSPGYMELLPLSEVISAVIGANQPSSQRVWSIYNSLISHFGDEYSVLIDAGLDELVKVTDPSIAEAIIRVRDGRIRVIPGYDGVYGQIVIFPEKGEGIAREGAMGEGEIDEGERERKVARQKSLKEFF